MSTTTATLPSMKQAIAGVSPSQSSEREAMIVYPSICAYPSGRFLGTLYGIEFPNLTKIGRLGNLFALLSIPHALFLYFYRVFPFFGIAMRYILTNRRVIVGRGAFGTEERSVALDNFDDIRIEVQDGQQWFKAGDLVFLNGDTEVFRLAGVSRPEAFRASCMKARHAYVGVKAATGR